MKTQKIFLTFLVFIVFSLVLSLPVFSQTKQFHYLEDVYVKVGDKFFPLSDYFEFTKDSVKIKPGKKFCVGGTCGLPGGGGKGLSNPVIDVLVKNNIEDLQSGDGIYVDKTAKGSRIICEDEWNWKTELNDKYGINGNIETWHIGKNDTVFVVLKKSNGNFSYIMLNLSKRSIDILLDEIPPLEIEDPVYTHKIGDSRTYIALLPDEKYMIFKVEGRYRSKEDNLLFSAAQIRDINHNVIKTEKQSEDIWYRDYKKYPYSFDNYFVTENNGKVYLNTVFRIKGDEYGDKGEGMLIRFYRVVYSDGNIEIQKTDKGDYRDSDGVSAPWNPSFIYDPEKYEQIFVVGYKVRTEGSRHDYWEFNGVFTRKISENGNVYDKEYKITRYLGNDEDRDERQEFKKNGKFMVYYIEAEDDSDYCYEDYEYIILMWNGTNLVKNEHKYIDDYNWLYKNLFVVPDGVGIEFGIYGERTSRRCDHYYYSTKLSVVRESVGFREISYKSPIYYSDFDDYKEIITNAYAYDFETESGLKVKFGDKIKFVNSCTSEWIYNIDKTKFTKMPSEINVDINAALYKSNLYYKMGMFSDVEWNTECYDGTEWKECTGGFIPEKIKIVSNKPFGFSWPYLVVLYQ